ncbi:MAG TPA: segregation/condensation protein A [Syntrophobacteria bacterium]|nr:segregation/condensation protein A [Syntrophobacteria bacterium]
MEITGAEYQVRLEIFEGPMDLLLHLIRKSKVDIYDIPIALVMDQYLAYLDVMRSFNIDVAAEFLEMAATLAYIKSRMLVPGELSDDEDEEEDPRLELVRPLMEYARLKDAAFLLAGRPQLGRDVYARDIPPEELWGLERSDEIAEVGLFELINALQGLLRRAAPGRFMEVNADVIRVKDRIAKILEILNEVSSITFRELFPEGAGKAEAIVTFLAILELVKLRTVRAFQHQPSGIIRLYLAVEAGAGMSGEG